MAVAALRELRLQTFKRVYRLDASELCGVLQEASKRRINNREVWDALLYRASLLRGEFRARDLAVTIDSLARIRYKDTAVLDYLLQEVRGKARQFLVRDASLLLNALAKFGLRDELLCQSLLPPLLRRITEKSKWEELSLLALSFARLGDPSAEPIFDQIVASLTPRMNRINDGHTLSLLACAFTRATGRNLQIEGEEMEDSEGARKNPRNEDEFLPLFQVEVGELNHLAFVELLLEQCDRHIFSFRGSDVLHLSLALVSLVRSGNEDVIPPRLLTHLPKRLNALYYELVPGQFVRFLELFQYLPEIEAACSPRILDELAYRARELLPRSCLPMLRASLRLNHARGKSVAAWRLTRTDAALGGPAVLTTAETCEAAAMLAQAAVPHRWNQMHISLPKGETSADLLWEAREALLILLQGLQKRHVDPKPSVASNLLQCAATLLLRDTHWFYLGQNLLAQQPLQGKQTAVPSPSAEEPLSEVELSSSILALARLSFPQLVDVGKLFSRAAASVKSPQSAAAVLEAAAIFSLTERKPEDLSSSKLAPMVALVADALRNLPSDDYESEAAALLPRLFPFSGRLANTVSPEVVDWRNLVTTATTMAVAASTQPLRFQEVVLQELSTWEGVELETDITVGPVNVPFAISLVQLAAFVRRQHGALDPAELSDASEDEPLEPEPEAKTIPAPKSGLFARRAKRKATERSGVVSMSSASRPEDFQFDEQISSSSTFVARPESHLLLDLLRYEDYYHASPSLRGERQRAKGLLLSAERHAEIQLLRQMGWQVICVAEHRWQEEPQANREMIFKLVADLTGDSR